MNDFDRWAGVDHPVPVKRDRDQAPDPRTLPPVNPPPTRDDGRETSAPVRRLG